MKDAYNKLLLDQLRLAVYQPGAAGNVDDGTLAKAVTVNENLMSLGYALHAADLLRLAASPSLDGFYASIEALVDQVKAQPMYPDFPRQVMELSEAQFRLHQAMHYFSTYGLEELFGVKVSRGWLPDVKSTPKTRSDDPLLAAKVLELLDESQRYWEPARRILQKRERMTLPEKEIIAQAAQHLSVQELTSLEVPFKENLMQLAVVIFNQLERKQAQPALRALFQHTGDVLEAVDYLLKTHSFHFRTSQKRLLVNLIESYPVPDWRANVILSGKKAQRNLVLLQYLDYSMYSTSAEHMAVVNSLRDGTLQSWEGQARALLASGADGALDFVGKRPGMLVRMVAWLIRMGYEPAAISAQLASGAASLSVQTLMTVLNFFGGTKAKDRAEASVVYEVLEETLMKRLSLARTELYGRRVFVDSRGFDLSRSTLQCSGKSAEGGYVASGAVYKIPDGVKRIRFFVYWNDPERVDVDLHARAVDSKGEFTYIGWNSRYNERGIVFSGDITHSDAAEYIDIDLEAPLRCVAMNIHLYSGKESFGRIETCFTGVMGVNQFGEEVRLYDPKNCFFTTNLRSNCRNMQYGYLDVENRTLVFDGNPMEDVPDEWYRLTDHGASRMNVARYLELLLQSQACVIAESREEADVVLVTEKAEDEKEISLIDCNYFMDAKPE